MSAAGHAAHHVDHLHHNHGMSDSRRLNQTSSSLPAISTSENSHHHHIHPSSTDLSHSDHHAMKMWFHWGCDEVILFNWWRTESWSGLIFSCAIIFIMAVLYEALKWFRVYFQVYINRLRATSERNMLAKKGPNGGIEEVLIQTPPNGTKSEEDPAAMDGRSSCCSGAVSQNKISSPLHDTGTLAADKVYAPTVTRPPRSTSRRPRLNGLLNFAMYTIKKLPEGCSCFIEAAFYCLQLLLAYWLMLIAMTFNVWLTAAVVLGAGFGHWIIAKVKLASPRSLDCTCGYYSEAFSADCCH